MNTPIATTPVGGSLTRLVRKFRRGDRVRLSRIGIREAKQRRGEYWDKWGTSGMVTGYSKGWLTGAINCVLVQCNRAHKAEPYQEKLWELDIPNTERSDAPSIR
jgi:hypothetical protein